MQRKTKAREISLTVGALITWFAVILQLYLIILNRITSVPETIIRFFSFYTVLTNILVAIYFTQLIFKSTARLGIFFTRSSVATAIAVYITVVGIVYNLILRNLWIPKGLQQLADELLHAVVPLMFILYWLAFTQWEGLQWKNVIHWLAYPLVYLIFILIRGSMSGFYPYPIY